MTLRKLTSPPTHLRRINEHHPPPLHPSHPQPSCPSSRFDDLSARFRSRELYSILALPRGDDGGYGMEVDEDGG
jgi:hypothetical protein